MFSSVEKTATEMTDVTSVAGRISVKQNTQNAVTVSLSYFCKTFFLDSVLSAVTVYFCTESLTAMIANVKHSSLQCYYSVWDSELMIVRYTCAFGHLYLQNIEVQFFVKRLNFNLLFSALNSCTPYEISITTALF